MFVCQLIPMAYDFILFTGNLYLTDFSIQQPSLSLNCRIKFHTGSSWNSRLIIILDEQRTVRKEHLELTSTKLFIKLHLISPKNFRNYVKIRWVQLSVKKQTFIYVYSEEYRSKSIMSRNAIVIYSRHLQEISLRSGTHK